MSHVLAGSERLALPSATVPLDPDATAELTLVLRRGSTEHDVATIRAVVEAAGLTVGEVHLASRRVQVSGSAAVAAELFGTSLAQTQSPDPTTGVATAHRVRSGSLTVPAGLEEVLVAVLGLDDRPQARAHFHVAAQATGALTLPQLEKAYRFPAGTDGTGQRIAIIELGGGFGTQDLATFFGGLDITPPQVTAVGVDGGSNQAGQDPNGADGEVLLDIEVAGALAPKATVLVYFAPNTDRGFLDAIATAVHAKPTPTVVSISWGGSEDTWTGQARTAMDEAFADAAALGVTVCVAAGDNGSSDSTSGGKEKHVDFPAASPHVLACGGTRLTLASDGTAETEVVWNDGTQGGATGGGLSDTFAVPDWQKAIVHETTGRGVPDVAGNADPASGYQVLVDGQAMVIGGTSAVAPLWAALVARLAQALGEPLGQLSPTLYAAASKGVVPPGFRDITHGSNVGYRARKGWDPCTGLGVPDGEALLAALRKP